MLFAKFRTVTVCIWPHIHSKLRIIRRTGSECAAARETEPNSKTFFISRAVRCFYDRESEICASLGW